MKVVDLTSGVHITPVILRALRRTGLGFGHLQLALGRPTESARGADRRHQQRTRNCAVPGLVDAALTLFTGSAPLSAPSVALGS
jgi:hypothetical protein